MNQSSPPETFGEKRYRMMRGKGMCHAHLLLYGGVQVCGKREDSMSGGIKLCAEHHDQFRKMSTPSGQTLIDKRSLEQLHRQADAYAREREQHRPLERRIRELEAEVKELTALPPSKRRKRTAPEDGHVYIMLSNSIVKIGWTSDVERRMREYGPGIRILAVMPGTRKDETRLHKKFADLRANRREWFSYHPRIMEEVERIVREHGDPSPELNEPMVTKRIVGPRLNGPMRVKDYRG